MLSIVIPTLNEKENLERLLVHLKKQMKRGDEVVVVDAYSRDGTPEVARKHGAKLVSQKPAGIGLAKTEGAKHAKNDIFVFLDADCVPSEKFLDKIRSHFKDDNLLAVGGLDLYESDSAFWRFLYNSYSRVVFYSAALIHRLTRKYWFATNNSAYRKDIFFSVGGFRSVVCEDTDMMKRLPASRNAKYDSGMVITLSDRRFREGGFFRTLGLWTWSNFLIMLGREVDTKGYRKH